MMSASAPSHATVVDDVRRDAEVPAPLAVRAWEQMCAREGRRTTLPSNVTALKRHKSAVFRLEGVGDGGSSVVAKRTVEATVCVERTVYERILPHVPLSTPRYYGYLAEPEGTFGWLFLEDVGDVKPAEEHRVAVAEWLAGLHSAAATLSAHLRLPDRGPAHYLDRLHSAAAEMARLLKHGNHVAGDREILKSVQRALIDAEVRWDGICRPCLTAARTLVHADFIRKNIRVRETARGTRVYVLDWETAGWGPPSADLADLPHRRRRRQLAQRRGEPGDRWSGAVPLDVYASGAAASWPQGEVRRLSRAGSVFRLVVAIGWAAEELAAGGTQKAMNKMHEYAADLPPAVAAAADDGEAMAIDVC